jgi:CRP-like cAMP-binding protein
MYLGKGQIFGEDCMLLNKPSLYTIKCRSAYGEVLVINDLEFVRRIKTSDETMRVIESICE